MRASVWQHDRVAEGRRTPARLPARARRPPAARPGLQARRAPCLASRAPARAALPAPCTDPSASGRGTRGRPGWWAWYMVCQNRLASSSNPLMSSACLPFAARLFQTRLLLRLCACSSGRHAACCPGGWTSQQLHSDNASAGAAQVAGRLRRADVLLRGTLTVRLSRSHLPARGLSRVSGLGISRRRRAQAPPGMHRAALVNSRSWQMRECDSCIPALNRYMKSWRRLDDKPMDDQYAVRTMHLTCGHLPPTWAGRQPTASLDGRLGKRCQRTHPAKVRPAQARRTALCAHGSPPLAGAPRPGSPAAQHPAVQPQTPAVWTAPRHDSHSLSRSHARARGRGRGGSVVPSRITQATPGTQNGTQKAVLPGLLRHFGARRRPVTPADPSTKPRASP